MEHLVEQISRHGLAFVFLNVLLEQVGLPIPALPVLLVAGALAAEGRLSLAGALALAVAASAIADFGWFLTGRRLGQRVLKTICRVSLSPESCVRQTEWFYERLGLASLVVAKFVPGYSTLAPPLAGISGTSAAAFLAADIAGAAVWAGSALAVGHLFHGAMGDVVAALDRLGDWGVALVLVGLPVYLAYRWVRIKQFQRALRMARITVEELRAMMDEGRDPLILDVRTPLAHRFDPRRIPGAIRFQLDQLDETLRDVPLDREIILYCT
ncbi:MAG TPA: VTT domain-containing protein [Thermoanaerobaculaceae bacterium]|nr:VTT domain-containing protein [Thermoanaerobaculaceae bacterium]